MEIKISSHTVGNPLTKTELKASPSGFAKIFDSNLVRTSIQESESGFSNSSTGKLIPDNHNLIELGRISSTKPTVSHLSIIHPEYGKECWQIIHSEQNKNKPYTSIQPGTRVYLDSESKEIIWDNSNCRKTIPFSKTSSTEHISSSDKTKSTERQLIDQSVYRASVKYNLPQALIKGVIKAESDFNVKAVSPVGAQGLMQLMPTTARELGVKNPFDIWENIEGGTKYLKKMLNIFNGNLVQALAAYNAGPEAVKKHHGQIPFQETKFYVKRVLSFLTYSK